MYCIGLDTFSLKIKLDLHFLFIFTAIVMELNSYKDEIIELYANKNTINAISNILRDKYGDKRGFSSRSIRRYMKTEGITKKTSADDLLNAVRNTISQASVF